MQWASVVIYAMIMFRCDIALMRSLHSALAPLQSIYLPPALQVTAKGFFRGTEEGDAEYKERYAKMINKFKDKLAAQAAAGPVGGGADTAPPPPAAATAAAAPLAAPAAAAAAAPPAAGEEAAEKLKAEGNAKLQAKDFTGAVESYTKAIQACPSGINSHIYFANRAAARQYLKQHASARDDCDEAIARSPGYAKAHGASSLRPAGILP